MRDYTKLRQQITQEHYDKPFVQITGDELRPATERIKDIAAEMGIIAVTMRGAFITRSSEFEHRWLQLGDQTIIDILPVRNPNFTSLLGLYVANEGVKDELVHMAQVLPIEDRVLADFPPNGLKYIGRQIFGEITAG